MVSNGEWWQAEDGKWRPTIGVRLLAANGQRHWTRFLIDTGADCTALAAPLQSALRLPSRESAGMSVRGVSGSISFRVVTAAMELARQDGGVAVVRGDFIMLTDPDATDLSVLGRDILDNFDLIASRRRKLVLLIAGHHQFTVTV